MDKQPMSTWWRPPLGVSAGIGANPWHDEAGGSGCGIYTGTQQSGLTDKLVREFRVLHDTVIFIDDLIREPISGSPTATDDGVCAWYRSLVPGYFQVSVRPKSGLARDHGSGLCWSTTPGWFPQAGLCGGVPSGGAPTPWVMARTRWHRPLASRECRL
jgi:hypothetical protein